MVDIDSQESLRDAPDFLASFDLIIRHSRYHAFTFLLLHLQTLDILTERNDGVEATQTLRIVDINVRVSNVSELFGLGAVG